MTSFDLFSPAFKADPYPTWAVLRREAPIYAHMTPWGQRVWYITRYDDVVAALKDERFVKDVANVAGADSARTAVADPINRNMLFSDPPDHARLRRIVGAAFTPNRVAALAPRIQQIADDLLNRVLPAKGMDLIADYALPLPVRVICAFLGVPAADQAQVTEWSQAIISPGSHGIPLRARKRRVRALVRYVATLTRTRRAAPADDLLSALVAVEGGGEALSEAELSSMVALLFVTGHETVVNLIGNGALALLQYPAQRQQVQAEPARMATAVEELLRYDGPVETSTTRWAREDLTFKGASIKAGDIVRVVLSAANRDPDHFPAPDQLDVSRSPNRHLAFGHGIHYCLGAPLARLEGEIALNTLLRRAPTIRLAVAPEKLEWRSGVLFRGLERLPVSW